MNKDDIQNPHDKFCRETLTDVRVARSFLQAYLPEEILSCIALDSLTICKDSFVEPDMKEYYSDILYQVELGSDTGLLYFLFEHKSHPSKRIFLQLLRYMLSIWNLYDKQTDDPKGMLKLPLVIPLVIYHGQAKWNMPTRFSECFHGLTDDLTAYIPDYTYLLYDLSQYTDSEIKGDVMTKITLLILKHAFDNNLLEKLPGIMGLLKELSNKETGLEYCQTLFTYMFNLSGLQSVSLEKVRNTLVDSLSHKQGDLIMTIAEQLRQEGRQAGWQEGKQEGWQEGMKKTAVNLKAMGMSCDFIQQATGLSPDEIQSLDTSEPSEGVSM